MQLHTDFSQRVVIQIEDSPLVGVQRRMLERDGEEVAVATSIVRYAPSSYFPTHTHFQATPCSAAQSLVLKDNNCKYLGLVSPIPEYILREKREE
ncbi:MAG: hypothetical protein HC934_12330 [Acaryochloridaceae cyanobacterium SU_2_1]|nr:hypothetical protein [Acaryochloridaceae cyanobacterium SU_2_1]